MNEEEAKDKWCPIFSCMAGEEWQECIASDCMMWRRIITCDDKDNKGYCGLGGAQ